MLLEAPRSPLRPAELPDPEPGPGPGARRASTPARVCRTDLHVVDGELPEPKLPLVPGHQIVGTVVVEGSGAVRAGRRASASPGSAGRTAPAATAAPAARTSATARASPATSSTAATPSASSPTSASASRSPTGYDDVEAAPLLCAGLIGYRSLRLAGDAERLGLYGFGAAAHIIAQVARAPGADACSPSRGRATRRDSGSRASSAPTGPAAPTSAPPEPLDAAIVFAPVGALVPAALRAVAQGRHRSSAPAST